MRFPARRTVARCGGAAALLLGTLWVAAKFVWPYPAARLAPESAQSRRFADCRGRDLRHLALPGGTRGTWVPLAEAGPWLAAATVAIEDHRFRWHPGIDPLAVVRAAAGNLVSGRITGGGSTLAQQLARLLRGETRRGSWTAKLAEAWDAWRLERRLGKEAILEQYLNRAPYGSQCTGIGSAAELFFGKRPDRLSLAEAALLAGLTRAPDAYSPYRHPEAARARRQTVLRRMHELGVITDEDFARALAEPVALQPERMPWHAPHFLAALADGTFGPLPAGLGTVTTTLDLDLQQAAEGLVRSHLARLQAHNARQAAVIVLELPRGEVRAWVGSSDFFSTSQVDGVLARRQPGSALKPFTYALAFAAGRTPADLVADVPITGLPDGFSPENYDRAYHGPVRLREALACSYNIPAVRVLKDYVTVGRLLAFLRAAGFASLDRPAEHYGLALTLGAGEVTLRELAQGYGLLACGGRAVRAQALPVPAAAAGEQLLPEECVAQITTILGDRTARAREFGSAGALHLPFAVAVKTGTSKDFRDNWCIGYTPRHVVAVWVGNFDGEPMRDCSGITGAAPLWQAVMRLAGSGDGAFPLSSALQPAEICPLSGMRPGPACPGTVREWLRAGTLPAAVCTFHRSTPGGTVEDIPPAYRPDGFRTR